MAKTVPKIYDIETLRNSANIPPHSAETEAAILGAILIDNNSLIKALQFLIPECFYLPKHRLIFEAMISLYEANEPIDSITLYEELRKTEKLESIGGATFIARLSQEVASAANINNHAKIILEKWIARELVSISMQIAGGAFAGETDIFDLLEQAEQKLFSLSQTSIRESFQPMKKIVKEAMELIEAIHSKKISTFSVPSGYYALDDLLGGFQKTDLIILAARPSMGKTAFALSIAQNAAIDNKIPIGVFSLEMSAIQLATRLISGLSRIDAHKIRTGKFHAEEGAKISRTVYKLAEAQIFIDDTPGLNVLEMRAKARRLKNEKNVGLIIVDYLQLMTSSSRMESREREISTISSSLKALAKEINVPVIALSQLNRAVESRTDKRPMLSDLRESGSIEQDADVVLFLYRPEVYGITQMKDGESTEGLAEVIIGKQRNGPTGEARLRFIKEYARFENQDLIHNRLPQQSESHPDVDDDLPI
ncbi:MAG: replicative DNA helicase [Melioribacteraceae bacterium]|nr:replicative DNA helicase [Melioribacteraceae bacterium]MCF8264526.1 replicative DNA helicase [Melioribacteraceae bacterium]MCF8431352.1 replicative DNA helicase [Melioribacteraceae bacterium]